MKPGETTVTRTPCWCTLNRNASPKRSNPAFDPAYPAAKGSAWKAAAEPTSTIPPPPPLRHAPRKRRRDCAWCNEIDEAESCSLVRILDQVACGTHVPGPGNQQRQGDRPRVVVRLDRGDRGVAVGQVELTQNDRGTRLSARGRNRRQPRSITPPQDERPPRCGVLARQRGPQTAGCAGDDDAVR
jgi:hypothetical protein